ncbi:exopolyphosphatase [Saccharopolyspora sp. HNM0986]|uniref:Ppx/GppA phosphatase family protein n=1 Tax=Saccharopolyspora galaxeae TaxID=2781241 RepID=UPI00190A7415|nr:exopolyphosphatase [Saccharopolyspora sp. HNM0986]MBK0868672.1 exopolyphosphatase [Saccharopolyspora sp. HNM0986]
MKLGLLDIGSTAARLELVDLDRARLPRASWSHKAKTRLADHTRPDGHVTEAGAEQAVRAVEECVRAAESRLTGPLVAFGTAAVRDAANGAELRERLGRAAGCRIGALSPHAEAALCFHAARRWHGRERSLLTTFDIGGGTAEVATGAGQYPDEVISLPLGAAKLTREHLPGDPPSPKVVEALHRTVDDIAAPALARFADADLGQSVGQSKVLRQLAVLAASSDDKLVRHPDTLARANLRRWIPRLAALSQQERSKLPGVSRSRARRILAGAVAADALLRAAGVDELDLCPWGLREGLVFRFVEACEQAEQRARTDAIEALMAEMFA